jgi:hypothetical protein
VLGSSTTVYVVSSPKLVKPVKTNGLREPVSKPLLDITSMGQYSVLSAVAVVTVVVLCVVVVVATAAEVVVTVGLTVTTVVDDEAGAVTVYG